jgi:hypothetical protein
MASMRDLFSDITPPLNIPPPVPEPRKDERRPSKLAAEFVRWCCSFGSSFRNSPDIANLRFWTQKNKIRLKDEEAEVLDAARVLFLKHIEKVVRASESS